MISNAGSLTALQADGTAEFIRDTYPWVQVIRKDTDSGPAASRTIGMLRSKSPFVALIDSDVQIEANWAERQLELLRSDSRIGVAGTKLLYGRNPRILFSAHGAMNRYGVSWDGGQGEPAEEFCERRGCMWTNTSAMLIRREAIDKAGAFDDRMFAFCEDSDFGWRVNLCGFRVVYNPDAVARHDVHGTFDPTRHNDMFVYLLRRNRIRSMLVNYGASAILRYVLVYAGLALAEGVAGPHRRLKLKALVWNLLHLGETLSQRRVVQRRRVVSDAALWHLFEEGIRGPGGDSMVRLNKGVELALRGQPDCGHT